MHSPFRAPRSQGPCVKVTEGKWQKKPSLSLLFCPVLLKMWDAHSKVSSLAAAADPFVVTAVGENTRRHPSLGLLRMGGKDLGSSTSNEISFPSATESSGNPDLHQHPAADHSDCSSSDPGYWWDEGGKNWSHGSSPWGGHTHILVD